MRLFVSHQTNDPATRAAVEEAFAGTGIELYFAEDHVAGKNLIRKLLDAVQQSDAALVTWTRRVHDAQGTRDIVHAEMGATAAMGRKLFVFREENAPATLFLEQVTDYATYPAADLDVLSQRLRRLARDLKSRPSAVAVEPVADVPSPVPASFRSLYLKLERGWHVLDVPPAGGLAEEPRNQIIRARGAVETLMEMLRKGERPDSATRRGLARIIKDGAKMQYDNKVRDGQAELQALIQDLMGP